jgi:hypothetical protein
MADKGMGTHPSGHPSKDTHPADTRPDNQGPGAGDKGFGRETNTGRPADAKPANPDAQPLKDRE